MSSRTRFLDSVAVSAFGNTGTGGGTSISSSYAETASFADYATSASYAISASHEIIKEVSSSHADTASYVAAGNIAQPFVNITASGNISSSGTYYGDGSNLTGIETDPFPYIGDAEISGSLTVMSGSTSTITGITLINPSNPGSTQDTGAGIKMFNYTGATGSIHMKDYTSGGSNPYHPAMIFNSSDAFYFVGANEANDGTWFTAQRGYQLFHMDQIATGEAEWVMSQANGGGSYSRLVIGQGSGVPTHGWFFQNNGSTTDLKIGETTGAGGSGTYTNRILLSTTRMQIGDSSNDLNLSVSGSITSNNTASAAYFVGDGSQLTGINHDSGSWDGQFTGSAGISGSLSLEGSGSTIFDVQGSAGQLFSVSDGLLGTLMEVNDISGMPLFQVSSSGLVEINVGDISGSSTSTASFGTYLGDGSQLTGINSSTNLTQSIFVTQNGDDSTATIGDLHKPFATLASASQAATTGSVIFVYPGLYVAPAENLAKPGVDWYFTPGTTVSKSAAGDIFDISGFTDTGMNVYGYADFILGSSAGSLMNSINAGPTFDYTFQCRDIFSDSSTNVVDFYAPDDYSINWEFRNMSASAGHGFYTNDHYSDGLVNITCDEIIAKEHCVGTTNGWKAGQIRAKKLTSTNNFAVHYYNGSHLTLIVDDAIGVGGDVSTLAYSFTSLGDIDIIGETTGIQMGSNGGASPYSGTCNHTGKCNHLAVEGMTGVYNGTHVAYCVMDGTGDVNFTWRPNGGTNGGYIHQSDGRIQCNFSSGAPHTYSKEIIVTGGILVADGHVRDTYPYKKWTVSGGTFIWKGIADKYVNSTAYGSIREIIALSGGVCKIQGTINLKPQISIGSIFDIVNYTGGKLILDGATLYTTGSNPAINLDQDRDVYIYSGGVNYNQTGSNALLNASGSGFSLTNVLGGMIIEDSSIE